MAAGAGMRGDGALRAIAVRAMMEEQTELFSEELEVSSDSATE